MSSDPAPFSVRRAHVRFDLVVRVRVERDDPFTGRLQAEETATENLSVGGAMVPTTLGVMKGESVRLVGLDDPAFDVRARVVGLRAGESGEARLRLQFETAADEERARAVLRARGLETGTPDVRP